MIGADAPVGVATSVMRMDDGSDGEDVAHVGGSKQNGCVVETFDAST